MPTNGTKFSSQSGVSLIEVILAASIMAICSLALIGLIGSSIASDTRSKFDSTTMMLAQSVAEQIKATVIGSGTAILTDCAGTAFTINTAPGGAALNAASSAISFPEAAPPATYHMDYVVKSPCTNAGIEQAVYDVRWHVDLIGAGGTPTNTYLLTVGAQMKNRGFGNKFFAAPVTLRVMLGN